MREEGGVGLVHQGEVLHVCHIHGTTHNVRHAAPCLEHGLTDVRECLLCLCKHTTGHELASPHVEAREAGGENEFVRRDGRGERKLGRQVRPSRDDHLFPGHTRQAGRALNLHRGVASQLCNLNSYTHWARLREEAGIDGVHCCEVLHVHEVDCTTHDVRHVAATGFNDFLHKRQSLLSLIRYPARHELHCVDVEAGHTRCKDHAVRDDA
mmetsp:Transcript_56883/g.144243  ORF Transcript_56883/g.144243 Transcript_56883/m.144243 type:complete len:210 (-) Transcript_56883:239-868(-)